MIEYLESYMVELAQKNEQGGLHSRGESFDRYIGHVLSHESGEPRTNSIRWSDRPGLPPHEDYCTCDKDAVAPEKKTREQQHRPT